MSTDALREKVASLAASASALAVLGAAIDARLSGIAIDATLQPHVDEIVDALGIRAGLDAASPTELRAMLGEIRSFSHMNAKLLYPGGRSPGWAHTETELLQSSGDVTIEFPLALKTVFAPALAGLAERLESRGATFLDIGAGVAGLAIEMARAWPKLRVVGLEPWGPSLTLARENVSRAGLVSRVEIREQAGEDLAGHDTFDLAWIPSAFLPARAIPRMIERVLASLRPGGWLLFAMARAGDDPLGVALARFRTVLFGGQPTTPEEVRVLLERAGYVEVSTLPGPPLAVASVVAARRKPK